MVMGKKSQLIVPADSESQPRYFSTPLARIGCTHRWPTMRAERLCQQQAPIQTRIKGDGSIPACFPSHFLTFSEESEVNRDGFEPRELQGVRQCDVRYVSIRDVRVSDHFGFSSQRSLSPSPERTTKASTSWVKKFWPKPALPSWPRKNR